MNIITQFFIEKIVEELSEQSIALLESLVGKLSGTSIKKSIDGKCWFNNNHKCLSSYAPLCQTYLECENLEIKDFENCSYREKETK